MVKLLILYYLNVKPTHGYEIQKCIQMIGLDVWAKIKSGSIYYALSKMEKNGEIELYKEEMQGSKVRKIYSITEKGKAELKKTLESELNKPLMPINAEKFIIPIAFNKLSKKEAEKIINKHIKELEENLEYWKHWKDIKVNNKTLPVERISFEMTINNIEDSIKWHKALIESYDEYVMYSNQQEIMIKNIDFGEIEEVKSSKSKVDPDKLEKLKEEILNNPDKSKDALDELINLMNSNI